MFKKKAKEESIKEEKPIEEKPEEEVIDKNIPNPQVAIVVVRDAIKDNVMCICNISKQYRHDVDACVTYLYDYINEPVEVKLSSSLQEQIDDGTLKNYIRTYEDNGYEINLTIKKKAKK